MKKFLCIMFALTICCLIFTGCESKEEKQANIDALIVSIVAGSTEYDQTYYSNSYILEAADKMYRDLFTEEDFEGIDRLETGLNKIYKDSDAAFELKKQHVINYVKEIMSSGDADKFARFIVKYYDDKIFFNTPDFLYGTVSYEELKDFLDKSAEKPITRDSHGGYYDDKKELYKNEYSDYYDPLSKSYVSRGEVGTYRRITSYEFYGDFLVEERKEVWYGNYSSNNSPDKTWYTTYFKDLFEIKGDAETNSGYGVDSEEGIDLNEDIYYISNEKVLIELQSWKMTVFYDNDTLEFYV